MTASTPSSPGYPVVVRSFVETDRMFVLETASRLADFGAAPPRTQADIVASEVRTLTAFFERPAPRDALLVAVVEQQPAGFIYLEEKEDYFTGGMHGHIGILAVARQAEGKGVAASLMRAAEQWATDSGHPFITLNVFDANHRARRLYERFDYHQDTIRYIKPL